MLFAAPHESVVGPRAEQRLGRSHVGCQGWTGRSQSRGSTVACDPLRKSGTPFCSDEAAALHQRYGRLLSSAGGRSR
jgi:hypothetical protein